MDLGEIWYGGCAIVDHHKIILQFSTIINNKMADEICDVEFTLAPFGIGSYNMYGYAGYLGYY
jgi:hypothetical protein